MRIQVKQLKTLIREAVGNKKKIHSDYQIEFTANLSIGPRKFIAHYIYEPAESFDYEYWGSRGTHREPGRLSDPTIEDVQTGEEFEVDELLSLFSECDSEDESGEVCDYDAFKDAYEDATSDAERHFANDSFDPPDFD